MNTRFLISQVTLLLLLISIYSVSSTQYVSSATIRKVCGPSNPIDKGVWTMECCEIHEDDEGKITKADCYKVVCNDKDCVKAEKGAPKINPEDFDILGDNDTKGPKPDLLQDGGLLEENGNTEGDDETEVPEDLGDLKGER